MKKILLIEDDTVLRENTSELLELSGYEVLTAANGKKGIIAAKEFVPHVIICDIMMPEVDGYEVLKLLSEDESAKRIPFIFLSAKTERKDVRKGMELGADDYLTKPFEESELIGAIESRLAKTAILAEIVSQDKSTSNELEVNNIHELKNYIDDTGQELLYEPGETIYRQGMHASTVYLVLEGTVKTHKLDEDGKELITGLYNPDDFFGFTCFVKEVPHQEYASAMERVKLAAISTKELKDILLKNHNLTMELMTVLSENLLATKEQLLEMAYGSVRKKTAKTILKFAEKLKQDQKGNIHVLRSDLASIAGMATETLIRTLSSFKKEGLIGIEDRNIRILDANRLSKVC